MIENLFALLITPILADLACDIIVLTWNRKRFNEKYINLDLAAHARRRSLCTRVDA